MSQQLWISVPSSWFLTFSFSLCTSVLCAGRYAQGVARSVSARAPIQNGCGVGASLPALRVCSRALMRDFAAMALCANRYDSLPVSTIWQ